MKRWGVATLIVALFCLPIWVTRSSSPYLLSDTDTRAVLVGIEARNSPLSWFATDWPLENHFYRPVSTLTFEFDRAAHGASAAGMGSTNALLAIGCVFALFWLIRELTDSLGASVGATGLFALWTLDWGSWIGWIPWVGVVLAIVTMFLPQRDWKRGAVAALIFAFLGSEIGGIQSLRGRMIDWIPGRTASTMALFLLLGLAAYARYERTSAKLAPPPEPTALDKPATRTTVLRSAASKLSWLWGALSLFGFALALGSYEQAVMGSLMFVGVALCLRTKGFQVRWAWPIATFGLVLMYLLARKIILPSTPSGYQEQQFRFTESAVYAIFEFVFPAVNELRFGWHAIASGWLAWLTAQPWQLLLSVGSNLASAWRFPKGNIALWFGFGASALSFAPMAFLKPFDHYYYLPMAFRAIFVGGLVSLAIDALVSAATRPAIQAPPRPDLEPG